MSKQIPISNLVVNPANYRFDPVDNEEEAIQLMLHEKGDEILNLAKHIVQYGTDEAKDLRVVKKGQVYICLDGNRRLTALKCLTLPNLIKDNRLEREFAALSARFSKHPIGSASCTIYPNEAAADEWIRLDHTGKNDGVGQDPWSMMGQERFQYKITGKLSLGMQAIDFLRKRGIEYDKKKMKLSTVNRILGNPESRSLLGLSMSKGELLIESAEDDVLGRLKKLFDAIVMKDVKVDEVYTSEKAKAFVTQLFDGKRPTATDSSTGSSLVDLDDSTSDQNATTSEEPPTPVDVFVVTAFTGLEDEFKAIKRVTNKLLKNPNVFTVNHSTGASVTQDKKIEKALNDSDFIIVLLSMGYKERLAYDAIKASPKADAILDKFYPINHNVLIELGYALRCRVGARKKDIFIFLSETKDGTLPTQKSYCEDRFFDIQSREQHAYSDIPSFEKALEQALKHCAKMKPFLK